MSKNKKVPTASMLNNILLLQILPLQYIIINYVEAIEESSKVILSNTNKWVEFLFFCSHKMLNITDFWYVLIRKKKREHCYKCSIREFFQ